MAQGEESNLAGIREGDEKEEFGEMEVGPSAGHSKCGANGSGDVEAIHCADGG